MKNKRHATKQMLIIAGSASCGKSTVIKMAYQKILQQSILWNGITNASFLYFTSKEVAVAIHSTALIGIASRGDSEAHVKEGLDYLHSLGCKIIICATRSKGDSLHYACEFAEINGFDKTVPQKNKAMAIANQHKENETFAKKISAWARDNLRK